MAVESERASTGTGLRSLETASAVRPLMKIVCRDIDRQEPLTQPSKPVGVPREALPQQGVSRMANLNGSYVVMMQQDDAGNVDLRSYSTAAL